MKKTRRVLSIFVLAMLNVSIMASLRNLPLVSEYGLSAVCYFLVVAFLFLIPCALVSAELATGWPKIGGVYVWVREGLGDRWGFFAIWMQWVHNVAWYPVILSFVATTLAYVIDMDLVQNKFYVLAVILIGFWGMTLGNYLGIKTSSWFSAIGVIVGTIVPRNFSDRLGRPMALGGQSLPHDLFGRSPPARSIKLSERRLPLGAFLGLCGIGSLCRPRSRRRKAPKELPPRDPSRRADHFLCLHVGSPRDRHRDPEGKNQPRLRADAGL